MPIRSVRNRILDAALAAALALGLTAGAPLRAEPGLVLSLEQARQLAAHALAEGNPGLAIQAARGLLQADPTDAFAYYVIAAAEAQRNDPDLSRRAASLAYRHAEPGADRFRSARLAARMAYAGGRPTLAQFWLRRSAIHAPDAAAEAVVARDYRILRARNPWSFRLQADLRPSSNVNKGADTALQIIDGVPVVGTLNGAAQALSGLIGSVDVAAGYRLRDGGTNATYLSGRLFAQRVALSAEARALAPNVGNSDYASTYAEITLRHGLAVGPPGRHGSAAVDLSLGESWSGGVRGFRFARVAGERRWSPAARDRLTLSALAEARFDTRYVSDDARIAGLGGEWVRRRANGDRFSLQVALRNSEAQFANGTYSAASLRAGYAFARPVGPVLLSAGVVLGYADYPAYYAPPFWAPGGRQDASIYGDVGMMFHQIDYAGFAPMLRLRAGRKQSNISIFTMREVSVSLGIESKF